LERRYHIRGAVGAAILSRLPELDWFKRIPGTCALALTPRGRTGLSDVFLIKFNDEVFEAAKKRGPDQTQELEPTKSKGP